MLKGATVASDDEGMLLENTTTQLEELLSTPIYCNRYLHILPTPQVFPWHGLADYSASGVYQRAFICLTTIFLSVLRCGDSGTPHAYTVYRHVQVLVKNQSFLDLQSCVG